MDSVATRVIPVYASFFSRWRLQNPGPSCFRLQEELEAEKRIKNHLPKLTTSLSKSIPQWENAQNSVFLYKGERYGRIEVVHGAGVLTYFPPIHAELSFCGATATSPK